VTEAQTIETRDGTITVPPDVLSEIVARSVARVDGARVRRRRRGIDVELTDGRARVSLELAVRFGLVLPEVARRVQEEVGASLRDMCGLEPEAVDVSIEELES
jgi:uncharacterized alkaline shock family protein YloU